jgi:hypothetical protein
MQTVESPFLSETGAIRVQRKKHAVESVHAVDLFDPSLDTSWTYIHAVDAMYTDSRNSGSAAR